MWVIDVSEYQISVVVPCTNAFSDFQASVGALEAQTGPKPEIIAVERLGPDFVAKVRAEFPDVQIITAEPGTTIPDLRATGIRAASAPAIGVLEDHVIVPPDWTEKMLGALADGSDVVAGPVDNEATETRVDWAAFLCEYSAVLPPLNDGPSDWLPGNNTAYRTEVMRKYDHLLGEGRWENILHDQIRADGGTLTLRNDIVSGHKMHYTFGLYFSQRFLYSRSFAGMRVKDAPLPRRLMMGAMAFALPPLVYYRVVKNVTAKGRHVEHLKRSLVMLVPFSLSWGAGEVAGYWFGAGRSLSKVK